MISQELTGLRVPVASSHMQWRCHRDVPWVHLDEMLADEEPAHHDVPPGSRVVERRGPPHVIGCVNVCRVGHEQVGDRDVALASLVTRLRGMGWGWG